MLTTSSLPLLSTVGLLKEQVRAFQDFPTEHLSALAEGSQRVAFEAQAPIMKRGTEAAHFGVVLEGEVEASVVSENGQRRTIGLLKAGDTFNEMALMTGDAVLADFTARTKCEVLLIPVSLFQSLIVTEPNAMRHIASTIAERMRMIVADPSLVTALRKEDDPYGLDLKGERQEKILVLNCGSSSLKYSFYDTADPQHHANGLVERIGMEGTRLKHNGPKGKTEQDLPTGGFPEAVKAMAAALTAKEGGVIASAADVSLVAHRVVHGGPTFTTATVITDAVLAQLDALAPLAPLHNPVNVAGIRELRKVLPNVPHVAVFDTAFHHTLPEHASAYGLPHVLAEEKKIKRYGFHGTSHQYVSLRAAQFLKRKPKELRTVSCHLGNGASICAVDHGRSVDTSMGFTPLEGLLMGTRSGDIDPGVLTYLMREENLTHAQLDELLNKKSGLLGLSGISSDMREVLQAAEASDARAQIALKAYCYRVRKYIGSYIAAMGGADVLLFTAGVGQGSAEVRALSVQGLECMGIKLDLQRNREAKGFSEVTRISTDDSPITVLVVPTDEERMMAREALRAVGRTAVTNALKARKQDPFLVEVSAHHAHLTQEHVEALFGKGHQLTRKSDLSQPGQFACEEQVNLIGPKGRIERVRVLGPARKYSQVEIALTEQFKLGVHPPIRESGDINGTPGCTLEGTAGSVTLDKGVICAYRHIHMHPEDALRYGVRDKSVVRVRIEGDRELIFGDVLVRVDPSFSLAMHIDTDEANAANVRTGAQGFIEGIQQES